MSRRDPNLPDEDFWSALKWGIVLGRESFAEHLRNELKLTRESSGRSKLKRRLDWKELVRCMEVMKGERWASFCDRHGDWGRDVTLWAARRVGGYTLRELARDVGDVDYSAIYQCVRRLEARSKKEKKLAEFMVLYRAKLIEMYNV